MISQETINALNAIPMPQIFDRYGIEWSEGRNFKRPWGNTATGRTPSCRYYPETNSVADFGTHKGGGPIRFVMLMDDLPFPAACKKLAGWFGIQGTFDFDHEAYSKYRKSRAEALLEKEREYNAESRYALIGECARNSEVIRSNLGTCMLASLLVQDEETFEDFLFSGEVGIESILSLQDESRSILRSYVERIQSCSKDAYSPLRNISVPLSGSYGMFTSIPILYPAGKTCIPLGFNDRDNSPGAIIKYKFDSVFSKRELVYGMDNEFLEEAKSCPVILTEGAYDALRLKSLGFRTAVSPLTARLTNMQAAILSPLAHKGFVLAFDGDSGGRAAADSTSKVLDYKKQIYTDAGIADGEDPDTEGLKNPSGLASKIQMAFNRLSAASKG